MYLQQTSETKYRPAAFAYITESIEKFPAQTFPAFFSFEKIKKMIRDWIEKTITNENLKRALYFVLLAVSFCPKIRDG